jgi:uncharacterized protein YabN with tetrapyrrole methylase and pyrophosphatase domain
VLSNWEEIKRAEKNRTSVTEGIPLGLPSLMLTAKLARKSRAVGLEPPGAGDVRAASQALARLAEAAAGARPHPDDPLSSADDGFDQAVGECLYVVANLAQRLGIDAEAALRQRALRLRDDIIATEGVPKPPESSH